MDALNFPIWRQSTRKIKDLVGHPRNPRTITRERFEFLKKSILELGFYNPIILDNNEQILAGHQRFRAMNDLGFGDLVVPVMIPPEGHVLTLPEINRILLMDNKSWGEWDFDIIAADYDPADLLEYGFDDIDFTEAKKELEEDEIPPVPEVAITKPGDLWILGSHRLLCGDSTNLEQIERLIDKNKVDAVFTDPPWNVNYGAVEKNHPKYKDRKIMNDNMAAPEWLDFCNSVCANLFIACKPGAMFYMVMSAQEWPIIDGCLRAAGFHWSSSIIWKKDQLVLSRKDYHTQYEPIWYGWRGDAARLMPLTDRKQSDVWDVDRPKKSDLHPTTKPIALIARALQNSSKYGDIVLDLFASSGSTLIACEQLERICNTMELDPKYCDVVIKRWQTLTGKDAILESTKQKFNEVK